MFAYMYKSQIIKFGGNFAKIYSMFWPRTDRHFLKSTFLGSGGSSNGYFHKTQNRYLYDHSTFSTPKIWNYTDCVEVPFKVIIIISGADEK